MAYVQDENTRPVSTATSLDEVKEAVRKAAMLAGRDANQVELVAISKTKSAADIQPLINAGQRVFGENRVQEAQEKWPELLAEYPDITLHMVGQLQSNKAEDAVELFDVIHSVDRPSLVKALGKAMKKTGRETPCFLQVDIGEEDQKGGCALQDLDELLALAREHGLDVTGLMCVPPLGVEPSPYFALLAKKARELDLPHLSMGMSSDFESAVKIGATHIRVGSALFGARD